MISSMGEPASRFSKIVATGRQTGVLEHPRAADPAGDALHGWALGPIKRSCSQRMGSFLLPQYRIPVDLSRLSGSGRLVGVRHHRFKRLIDRSERARKLIPFGRRKPGSEMVTCAG